MSDARLPSPTYRRRPAWGWRLAAYVALLVFLSIGLQGLSLWMVDFEVSNGLSLVAVVPALLAALAASWVMMSKVESRPPAALGLVPGRRAMADFVRGAAVGGILVGAVVLVMVLAGWLDLSGVLTRELAAPHMVVYLTVILLLAAFLEELVVRGYPFQVLAEARGPGAAITVTALVFGALHGANPGVGLPALVNTVLAGILLGIMYWRTFSLWLVTGAHLAWNWTMGVLFGLPVSGLDVDASRGAVPVQGPELMTGGAYGPEGGLLLGLAALIGIFWMARTPRLSRDPAVLVLAPLPLSRMDRSEGPVTTAGASARIESEAK